jgi:hypothetical protein
MAGKNQHVVPHDGKWAVKGEGSKRVTAVYDAKKDAIDAARKIARDEAGKLVVHGRSGQVFRKPEAHSSVSESVIRQAVRGGTFETPRKARKKAAETSRRTIKN